MKSKLLITFIALIMGIGAANLRVLVVTPTPEMHCENCENKIKSNMRFEKGVKKVETNLETQEVTITYDARKNCVEGLQQAMKKIGYDTKVVSDKELSKKATKKK